MTDGPSWRVLVTGATGFVGRHVVAELLRRGHAVLAVSRRAQAALAQHPGWGPALTPISLDLRQPSQLRSAAEQANASIHLVGVIREEGQTFTQAHVQATQAVVEAAQAAGHKRLIHMSALGASADDPVPYLRTKGLAEGWVRSGTLPWTIFRPSLIHGPDGELMSMLLRFVKPGLAEGPIALGMPVFGSGRARLQPVHVDDVARLFASALTLPESAGMSFDVGGPDALSWVQLHQAVARAISTRERPVLHVPPVLGRLLAATVMRLPLLPGPLRFDAGMVDMSQRDNVCDLAPLRAAFHFHPLPFEATVRAYASQILRSPEPWQSLPTPDALAYGPSAGEARAD